MNDTHSLFWAECECINVINRGLYFWCILREIASEFVIRGKTEEVADARVTRHCRRRVSLVNGSAVNEVSHGYQLVEKHGIHQVPKPLGRNTPLIPHGLVGSVEKPAEFLLRNLKPVGTHADDSGGRFLRGRGQANMASRSNVVLQRTRCRWREQATASHATTLKFETANCDPARSQRGRATPRPARWSWTWRLRGGAAPWS